MLLLAHLGPVLLPHGYDHAPAWLEQRHQRGGQLGCCCTHMDGVKGRPALQLLLHIIWVGGWECGEGGEGKESPAAAVAEAASSVSSSRPHPGMCTGKLQLHKLVAVAGHATNLHHLHLHIPPPATFPPTPLITHLPTHLPAR